MTDRVTTESLERSGKVEGSLTGAMLEDVPAIPKEGKGLPEVACPTSKHGRRE